MSKRKSTDIRRVCKACSKVFWKPFYRSSAKFCSEECWHKSRKVYCVCKRCKKIFWVYSSTLYKKNGGSFCSRSCHSTYTNNQRNKPLYERFLGFTAPKNKNGCILWTASTDTKGYGH